MDSTDMESSETRTISNLVTEKNETVTRRFAKWSLSIRQLGTKGGWLLVNELSQPINVKDNTSIYMFRAQFAEGSWEKHCVTKRH